MNQRYTVQVKGKTLATFADYATWDAVQDAMKCARKDCNIPWSNSVDCSAWTINYWHECEHDGYILTYYRELEAIRKRLRESGNYASGSLYELEA